jgi:hypothetical protein
MVKTSNGMLISLRVIDDLCNWVDDLYKKPTERLRSVSFRLACPA